MKKILLLLLFIVSINLYAAPYNGQIQQFKQPDGSIVEVRLYGTEYYMRAEGLDNYTVIRDKNTKWICYARLSADGTELISSGIVYKGLKADESTLRNDLKMPQHLDITPKAREEAVRKTTKKLGIAPDQNLNAKTAWHPVLGEIKGLCIVVDFSDEPSSVPISEFTDFCNSLNYSNYGNNGSLRQYFSDVSGGLVDYQNVVYGYYRAPLTFAAYEQLPYAQGAQDILGLTLAWIESLGFDFSTLSTNPDNSIQAINLMYTGDAQTWADGMWWHQGYYGSFSADGVHSGAYNCSPANNPLRIATVCHENGHMIGKWPDTYKYNNNTGPDGIGDFDLMCWYGDSYNPVPPNPHFRSNAAWGNVVDVTFFNGIVSDTANSLTCYKYRNLNDTNEFFLIENRAQTGRSSAISDEGLTIWHIDRNGDNQSNHHEVYLVHANDDVTNHYDACFHEGFNDEYAVATTPSSVFFNGDPSGLRVWDIGAVNNVMTYKLGAGVAAPSFFLAYQDISGDNNSNGFLEPGESGDINIDAANFGQLISGNAIVTCTAVGSNASMVIVNSPVISVGPINVQQTIALAHNISISASAVIGSVINLKFEISDGVYSTFITKAFVLGQQFIMDNYQVSTCSAMFYDHGGNFSNYDDNSGYVTTFLSPGPWQPVKADFLSFDLEDEVNCIYDYLNIYDGPSTSAPLIGMYCGSNSPGSVVSSHPSGALTFEFHADEGVTGEGWSAIISCMGTVGVNEPMNDETFVISPNPSSGIININLNTCLALEVSIVDVTGREVFSAEGVLPQSLDLDLSARANGVYSLRIRTKDNIFVRKIMICK